MSPPPSAVIGHERVGALLRRAWEAVDADQGAERSKVSGAFVGQPGNRASARNRYHVAVDGFGSARS